MKTRLISGDGRGQRTDPDDGAVSPDQERTAQGRAGRGAVAERGADEAGRGADVRDTLSRGECLHLPAAQGREESGDLRATGGGATGATGEARRHANPEPGDAFRRTDAPGRAE